MISEEYTNLHLHHIGQTEHDGYVTLRWMCGKCLTEIERETNPLIILPLSLTMEPKNGDEHLHHHPVCEVCQKEFDDVHELSKHVNEEHRNQDRAA